MLTWIAYILGPALVVLALLDVFLEVLYARSGAGVVSRRLAQAVWRTFRSFARAFPRRRDAILSFAGPTQVVATIALWVLMLLLGLTLIVWPAMGTGIQSAQGHDTPTDFWAALYVAGQCLTTLGKGDLVPTTGFYRVLVVFAATIGLSIITLTLTYLVEVYTALQARNTYALSLHHASGNSDDAAELLAGLGAGGDFEDARGELSRLGTELVNLYESHHFYTSLMHFRFREQFYGVPRMALVTMELATLIASALDARRYQFLRDSAQVKRLWTCGMHLLQELSRVFLPGGPAGDCDAQPATRNRWRRRYDQALLRLREAGIETSYQPDEGFERYVELREKWDAYVMAFARYLEHPIEEVDPAMARLAPIAIGSTETARLPSIAPSSQTRP